VEREIKLSELEPEMFLLLLSVLVLVIVWYRIKFSARDAAWLTFPRLGNFLLHSIPYVINLNSDNALNKLMQWHEDLGEVFLMTKHVFDSGTIIVADPEIAQEISFHQSKRLPSLPYVPLTPWLGYNGLIQDENTNTNCMRTKRYQQFLKLITFSLGREKMQRVSNYIFMKELDVSTFPSTRITE
jgi:hypothetical protein